MYDSFQVEPVAGLDDRFETFVRQFLPPTARLVSVSDICLLRAVSSDAHEYLPQNSEIVLPAIADSENPNVFVLIL